MRKQFIAIAPEGYPFIALLIVTALVFALIKFKCLAIISLILLWFVGHFFRDPERVIPQDEAVAISPADGKILRIEDRISPISGKNSKCISIFMNIFNVHVNRMPLSGKIEKVTYIPGLFLNASFDKASEFNERCIWHIVDADGESWDVVQIAGLIARRIVPYAQAGDELERGERFGMIRFGSCVEIYMPDSYEPVVSLNDIVHAGETIIARRRA